SITMKITYIAIAAVLAQVCIAGTLPCTASQDNACGIFQSGPSKKYLCACTAEVSCSTGQGPQDTWGECNSAKRQLCKNFCAT
ncbi:hypothetical protein BGX24_004842, partial [Mortierella sp. AD032]